MNYENSYEILWEIKNIVSSFGQLNWLDYIQIFITIISGVMDIILFSIAIYTFYLNFVSNKISIVTFGESFSMWESDKINFVIRNKSLRTKAVTKVYAVFDNKYRLLIRKYDLPCVLEPLRSKKIEMEPYTCLDEISLSELCHEYTSPFKIHLEIITDEDEKIYAKIGKIKNYKINKKASLKDVFMSKIYVNGIVVKDDYKYVLYYKIGEEGKTETAFINDFGFISTDVFGFNHISKEYLSDEQTVKECFRESCEKNKIQLLVYDIKKKTTLK